MLKQGKQLNLLTADYKLNSQQKLLQIQYFKPRLLLKKKFLNRKESQLQNFSELY
ncbi:MAG: hypothetical protein N4J56_004342 [Chroococcidiopsis sp. SAG 2025]|nr:hypothetical protein [Chroococcidiopsis sp. SAG 2025]